MNDRIPRPEDVPTIDEVREQQGIQYADQQLQADFELAGELQTALENILISAQDHLTRDGVHTVQLDRGAHAYELSNLLYGADIIDVFHTHPGWLKALNAETARRQEMVARGFAWYGWDVNFGSRSEAGGWSMGAESQQPDSTIHHVRISAF